jgi:hypothetical protein
MNNPDHISESLGKFFWVKILEFFDADSDVRDRKNSDQGSEIQDGKNSDPG